MRQNEIWLINLDPTVGAEIKKTRPAVKVCDDALGKLPLKIIVPITDWKELFSIASWLVKILPEEENGLTKPSAADCFQVRSLSKQRFVKRIVSITPATAEKIKASLLKVLSIW